MTCLVCFMFRATVEKHNRARQPVIVLVSLYSSSCIITFAMDYGYVAPDIQNTHLSFNMIGGNKMGFHGFVKDSFLKI